MTATEEETTTVGVNEPLLKEAIEWAEYENSKSEADCRWEQSAYIMTGRSCGTAYCIAGYVAHRLGWTDAEINETARDGVDVADAAADALGIPRWDIECCGEDHLFSAENTIEDVRGYAEQYAGHPL